RSREDRLDLLPAGGALLEYDRLGEVHGVDEGVPDTAAQSREADRSQRGDGGNRGCDRVPALAREQRDRNQHAELRLVGEQADQPAGAPRPAIEQLQRAAEQRRGEESILAMTDVDEYRGKGGCDQ